MNTPLWEPPEQRVNNSNLLNFTKFVGFSTEYNFKKFWQWSVAEPEIFWSKFWDYSKIIGNKGNEIIRKDKRKRGGEGGERGRGGTKLFKIYKNSVHSLQDSLFNTYKKL